MNYRQNQDISWNFVDAQAVSSSFDQFDMNPDNGTGWYPSPPAEEPFALYSYPSSPLDIDIDLSSFVETTSSSASDAYMTPSIPSPVHARQEQTTVISISTTFYPGNPGIPVAPNMVLSSEDGTLFYLNSHFLARTGFNVFSLPPLESFSVADCSSPLPNTSLLQSPVSKLPDSSTTLDIIFHTIYGLSCAARAPSFDAIAQAISRMQQYNLSPSELIQPGTPLYVHLMSGHAPFHPLKLYTLAAKHGIEPLAVGVSSHLLGLSLSEITDDDATAMGSVYLKRLFFMHKGRTERLKNILVKPPTLHELETVEGCDITMQAALRRKWALLVTSLAWDAKPDISPRTIQEHFRSTGEVIQCSQCRQSWRERSVGVATEWATVKVIGRHYRHDPPNQNHRITQPACIIKSRGSTECLACAKPPTHVKRRSIDFTFLFHATVILSHYAS
ncbi:hypothetical protein BKA70DRAFT_1559429 [Coprinopsis sp. MPI-PUGE-AT-0042]|nr:hypothetical protein BKA70DRAFT_1559429 [Coprinopsis sp. MPI-PUGE-AT-0042]